MTAPRLFNRIKQATATTGTGTITLGAAATGFRTLAMAGAVTGQEIRYVIEDGAAWEIGVGVYTSTGPTLTRVLAESSTGSLLNLSGSATVMCAATRSEVLPSGGAAGHVLKLRGDGVTAEWASDGPRLYDGILAEEDFGQSLMVHSQGTPALTTSQDRRNLMFTGGLRASATSASTAAFVAAVEATGETGAVIRNKVFIDMIASEDGLDYDEIALRCFTANCGVSGEELASLSRGGSSNAWTFLNNDQTQAVANAATLQRNYRVENVNFRQGEYDQRTDYTGGTTPSETFKRMVRAVRQMIENDCYRTNPSAAVQPVMIGYQLSSHYATNYGEVPTIAWALLDLYEDLDLPFFLSNPTYYLPHATDAIHMTNVSYARLGAREGYVKKRVLVDGVNMRPLAPILTIRSGTTVKLRYPLEDGTKLVLDTTAVSDPGNYGFQLYDDLGAAMTISSVVLSDRDEVTITASASIPAGATVYYASLNGTANKSGPTEGPRGCLRDNAGDVHTFVVNGVTYANHGWAAICKKVLS